MVGDGFEVSSFVDVCDLTLLKGRKKPLSTPGIFSRGKQGLPPHR
jgi:hypothetical protein